MLGRHGSLSRRNECFTDTGRAASGLPPTPHLRRPLQLWGCGALLLRVPQENQLPSSRFSFLLFLPISFFQKTKKVPVLARDHVQHCLVTSARAPRSGTDRPRLRLTRVCRRSAHSLNSFWLLLWGMNTPFLCLPCPPPKLELLWRAAPSAPGARSRGARFQSSPSLKGIIISGQTLCQSLAAQLPPKRAGCFHGTVNSPSCPSCRSSSSEPCLWHRETGGAGARILAACRLWEGKPEEEMTNSAVLVAITGMWVLLL